MDTNDTIVAISSAIGTGARIIVRLSGDNAQRLARAQLAFDESDAKASPLSAAPSELIRAGRHRARVRIAGLAVPTELLVFVAPYSATSEDVVEFHLPGSVVLARSLTEALIAAGARHAEPGEFSARAFLHGKLDLTAIEGVAATIAAGNELELQAARRLAAGELSTRVRPITDLVAETLSLIEAGIDFSDEGVSFLARNELEARITTVERELRDLIESSSRFDRLQTEPRVVLAGRPNAGKSSLLNALAGASRAVVSDVSGTTRDALTARVIVPGGTVIVVDVAGLDGENVERASATDSQTDPHRQIESHMRARARREIEQADIVLLVKDLGDSREPVELPVTPNLVVRTKCDLYPASAESLCVSAVTHEGLDRLKTAISKLVFERDSAQTLVLNSRHHHLIGEALDAMARAQTALDSGTELVALELRIALDRLGDVTGAVTTDDVLGRIFSTFCIGK